MKSEAEKYLSGEFQKKVAKNMKLCRKVSRPLVTQEEMANILHVERQHVIKIGNGKLHITIEELMVYCALFEVDPSVMLMADETFLGKHMQFKNTIKDTIYSSK